MLFIMSVTDQAFKTLSSCLSFFSAVIGGDSVSNPDDNPHCGDSVPGNVPALAFCAAVLC